MGISLGSGYWFAVDFDFDVSGVTKELNTFGKQIFDYVRDIISVSLFGVAFWMAIDGHMNKNLGTKWFAIIGLVVFSIFLAAFPRLFSIFSRAAAGVSVD